MNRWPRPVYVHCRGTPLRTAMLPNGLRAAFVSRNDLFFLYNEVFEARSYLKHGINLDAGDTVLDVGANIGLFSIFAATVVGKQGRVIAAEPIPAILAAMEYNIASLAEWSSERGSEYGSIEVLNAGVGDGSQQEAVFTFYPRAAGWSSMQPNSDEVQSAMEVFLHNALENGSALPQSLLAESGKALRKLLPGRLFRPISRLFVQRMLSNAQECSCKLKTVSDLISEYSLSYVDLLKIDVERAELEVLQGVLGEHWPRIRQVVLEVHNLDNRLQSVKELLGSAGFGRVVAEQAQELEGSSLYNVYATR